MASKLIDKLTYYFAYPHEYIHLRALRSISNDAEIISPSSQTAENWSLSKPSVRGRFSRGPSIARIILISLAPTIFFWSLGIVVGLSFSFNLMELPSLRWSSLSSKLICLLFIWGIASPDDIYSVVNPDLIKENGGFTSDIDYSNKYVYICIVFGVIFLFVIFVGLTVANQILATK